MFPATPCILLSRSFSVSVTFSTKLGETPWQEELESSYQYMSCSHTGILWLAWMIPSAAWLSCPANLNTWQPAEERGQDTGHLPGPYLYCWGPVWRWSPLSWGMCGIVPVARPHLQESPCRASPRATQTWNREIFISWFVFVENHNSSKWKGEASCLKERKRSICISIWM